MNNPIQRNVYNTPVVNTNTPVNTPKRRGRPPGLGKSNSKYIGQNNYKKTYNYSKKKGRSSKEFSGSSDDFSDNFDDSTSEDEKKDFSNEDDWEDYATTPVSKSMSEKEKQPYSGKKRGRKPKNFHLLAENKEPSSYRVFDTDLANMAADAVMNNTFTSIIEFHKSKGLNEVHRTPVNPVTSKSTTTLNYQSINSSRILNSKPSNTSFNYNEQKTDKLKLPIHDNTHSIPTNMISRPVNNVIVQTQTPVGFAPSSLGNSMFGASNQLASKQFFDMTAGQNSYAHQQILKNAADMNNIMSHPINDQFYSNAVYVPNSFNNNQNTFCNSPNNFIKNNSANNMKPMTTIHTNAVPVNLLNNKRPYLPVNTPNSINQQFNSFSQNAINRSGFIQHNMNSGVMSVNPSGNIVMESNCQTNTTNQ